MGDFEDSYKKASYAPPGEASSYVAEERGGADPGSRNFLDTLMGQDKTHVNYAEIATLPDAGDENAIAAANAEYQQRYKDWLQQIQDAQQRFHDADGISDLIARGKELEALTKSPPAKPDLSAIEHRSDRARLLNMATNDYRPLIDSLKTAAEGKGPSAALNYYRAAADDAAKRNYGMAASARGTGGQRAALFQAAMGQNAEQAQGAARQAAIIGAEEQNQARASLNAALTGLTGVYGTSNLLGDTRATQEFNANARNEATNVNAGIAKSNAANAQQFTKDVVNSGAKAAKLGA